MGPENSGRMISLSDPIAVFHRFTAGGGYLGGFFFPGFSISQSSLYISISSIPLYPYLRISIFPIISCCPFRTKVFNLYPLLFTLPPSTFTSNNFYIILYIPITAFSQFAAPLSCSKPGYFRFLRKILLTYFFLDFHSSKNVIYLTLLVLQDFT